MCISIDIERKKKSNIYINLYINMKILIYISLVFNNLSALIDKHIISYK
uniref:Uncharacterized 5.7 kDa protein in psbM-psbX intergenic region n=1 Tax=Cyanophora paradoxa TaxID=2762 RepID=YCX9_CYAPA|nr:hypothetical protein CypaCp114 [Cyanophora paradoxa]P48330.1 RecName: Full=Uncharacterized 5.7 kDa protein in psbM-psbX intergenic region; AltName: Full=ORF48 [Cyanophora paradoxa]AAA81282.1 orf48 [Cyanophora paradoxa]